MDEDKRKEEQERNEYGERMYPDYIKESQTAYQATGDPALGRMLAKKQGEYTVEDYYALPEDCRVELIDGVIYNMAAPTWKHQGIASCLCSQFIAYVAKNKGKCRSFTAPCDVRLDQDDKTMVQPDILIACDWEKFRERVYYGAPDLVVEVLSPSSRRRDREIKYQKYRKAGVREYWIVDPIAKRVTVHDFEHGERTMLYTFEDKILVGIWGGECLVDFAEIYEMVSFLYE